MAISHNDLNENIVPKELIVGISGGLCYITFYEKKGKKLVLNSEKSWTSWSSNASDPIVVKNEFMTGFKIGGVNTRWSSNASNSENLLITHPAFNKSFEISLKRFTEIASKITIKNGVLDEKFIVTKTRDIITEEEYKKLNDIDVEEQNKKKELAKKNKSSSVKPKDQVPGCTYINRKNNIRTIYLGEVTDRNLDKPKYAYIEYNYNDDYSKAFKITKELTYGSKAKNGLEIEHPSIINAGLSLNKWRFSKPYRISVVSSKKQMAYEEGFDDANPPKSIYDEYSEEDWEKIYSVYKKIDSYNKTYFHGTKNEPILKWHNKI